MPVLASLQVTVAFANTPGAAAASQCWVGEVEVDGGGVRMGTSASVTDAGPRRGS